MKKYKSITNSMRHVLLLNQKDLSNKKKILSLSKIKKKHSGRNNTGKIMIRSKSSKNTHKNFYRIIDYKRLMNSNIPGKICRFEYDPNRSSFITLVRYWNNIYCYIIGISNLSLNNVIYSYNYNILNTKTYNLGDSNSLIYLPKGSIINNIEYIPNHGSVYARSAGTYGILLKKYININKALIELPSKVQLYISIYNKATLGVICNSLYSKISLGKAGRNRWLGRKSIVRGVAKNAIDHPHGGGEGKKNNPALQKNPWGKALKWNLRNKKNVLY